MLSENLVINVQSVSKKYKLYNQIAATSLLQSLFNLFKTNSSGEDNDFWALHGISFAVEKGDILGIIGPNGSGKSTLLKILSGIITPNEGEIAYRGKIKSILDIGTGFHPDLSGRENVYLNGNLLGMSRSETSAKFDDIAAFSNIGEFIDMPVKTYSAGMFLRLAFSVSFILKADILLIDEVLSVGDMAFRQQCTQKIRELSKEGVTMLVISHDINEVMELCNKCLLLNEGKVVAFGKTKQVVDVYTEQIVSKTLKLDSGTFTPIIHEKFILQDISVYASHKSIGAPICMEDEINIDFRVHKLTSDKTLEIIMFITNSFNVQILADSVVFRKDYQLMDMPSGKYTISCRIPANFFNYGHYTISVFMAENKQKIDDWNSIYKFAIIPNEWEKNSEWIAMNTGLRPYLSWNVSNISS